MVRVVALGVFLAFVSVKPTGAAEHEVVWRVAPVAGRSPAAVKPGLVVAVVDLLINIYSLTRKDDEQTEAYEEAVRELARSRPRTDGGFEVQFLECKVGKRWRVVDAAEKVPGGCKDTGLKTKFYSYSGRTCAERAKVACHQVKVVPIYTGFAAQTVLELERKALKDRGCEEEATELSCG